MKSFPLNHPPHATTEELKQFEESGFFVRKQLFRERELDEFRRGVEHIHQQILDASKRSDAPPCDRIDNQRFQVLCGSTIKWEWREDLRAVRSMEPCAHLDPRINALLDDPRLWGPIRKLIDCEALSLFSDKLNMKRPAGAPFPWHQDGPYWAYGAGNLNGIINVLLYLDDSNQENGCLWVIPGSHRFGPLKCLEQRGVLGKLYTDINGIDGKPHPVELPAGSLIYFHHNLVHGSQSNRSRNNRRAFVAAYQPAGLQRWRLGEAIRNIAHRE